MAIEMRASDASWRPPEALRSGTRGRAPPKASGYQREDDGPDDVRDGNAWLGASRGAERGDDRVHEHCGNKDAKYGDGAKQESHLGP
jgi:hypothetical protein